MTADYAYSVLQFLARKNQTAQITPSEYQYAIKTGQDGFYDYLIGQLEQYRYDKPVPRVGVGMSSRVSGFLTPLKKSFVTIPVVGGVAAYPTSPKFDYLALMTDSNSKTIDILEYSKLPARLNSKIDPITDTSKGFAVPIETGWQVYPSAITSVIVSYYFRPPDSVWGYTVTSDGQPVYNPATSVDPSFDDIAMTKVLATAAKALGFSFTDQTLVEYGKEVEANGR